MTYSMARFSPASSQPVETDLIKIIQATTESIILDTSLAKLISRRREKKAADERAKRSVKLVMELIGPDAEAKDASVTKSNMFKEVMTRFLKFVGKQVFKRIVRPVLEFAVRAAMNIVRFAIQSLVRYAIVPVIEAIVALAVANPVTAGVVAVLVVAGGGYWVWKKFFSDEVKPQEIAAAKEQGEIEPLESQEAEAPIDLQTGPQARLPSIQPEVESEVYQKTFSDYIAAPVKAIENIITPSNKKGKKSKFTGFGADVDSYIREGSQMYGLPEDQFRGFIRMEAGWTGAMSPTGAIGTGQFIQSTWDQLAATEDGKKIGMTKIGKRFRTPEDPRFDKRINTLATALLARENKKLLEKAKLPVTGENLYMMHNIGPGIIDVMLGKPASEATLKAMRLNGMTNNMSAADFLVYQKGRFNVAYKEANQSTVISSPIVMKPGMTVDKQASVQGAPVAGAATSSTSEFAKPDREIVRGKGKALIGVS